MVECEKVRSRLVKNYGKKVLCRIGNSENIEYNASKKPYENADIAVYIHKNYRIAIVWNLENRRLTGRSRKTFSLSQKWEDIRIEPEEIRSIYKKMGTRTEDPYEKVLALDVDTLAIILEDISLYLKIDPEDETCPNEIKKGNQSGYDIPSKKVREKISTHRWERNRKFRKIVLEAYGYKCAICRCEEEKILEAAHIVAVSDGGTDDVQNGIFFNRSSM